MSESDYQEIPNRPWQKSTLIEQNNKNDHVIITISPSQFRSLLSSPNASMALARHIVSYVLHQISVSDIIILIADEIQKYNVAVFEHKNAQSSLKTAKAQGEKISSLFSRVRADLSLDDSQKIKIIHWEDMVSSSNYDARVQHIRQYIDNNQSQCIPLIDVVCNEYARARNPNKNLKQKNLFFLREYVMHELPALLDGIEYGGNTYKFMLHPVLKTNSYNGYDQREAMVNLLNYMREYYLPSTENPTLICHIFDIEFSNALIATNDESQTDPSDSSTTTQSDLDCERPETSNTSIQNIDIISGHLWLTLIMLLAILFINRFWLPIFCVSVATCSLLYLYMLLIQQISKRGQWLSTSTEQSILGTDYCSFFGDLPAIQECQNGYFLYNLRIELGRPRAYRIWMGPEPALMLAHPQSVKDFWEQHKEKEVERDVHLGWPLEMLMSHGVGFRSMDDRSRITKYFHNCFGSSQVRCFDKHLETTIMNWFHQSNDLTSLNYKDIKYLAHDAGVHLFLGPIGFDHLNELHSLVDQLGELMTEAFDARWTNLPVIGYYFLPRSYKLRKRIRRFNQQIRNVLLKIINAYRLTPDNDDENENISLLARFARDANPSITFDELTDTIVEGLLAPNDGTAGTFMYTLLLLAMNPHIQNNAREMLQNAQDLTLKSIENFKYLDQILNECQRLFPIFMFNVPEFASQEMTVSGVRIPKNTMVMLDVMSLNRNEETWGPDPLSFRPERFDPPVSPMTIKSYHGFGNGHFRRCLGQYMIKSLHKLFLVHLLTRKQVQLHTNIASINEIERFRLPFIYIPNQSVKLLQL
ncbi:unnamed protein product [Adineta ricciae]|uniref:Cytochrome P450 n=1 Tax=Adineta ricciae TaxID=249248 RepID=A0A814G086_ADIRI|nr:unnamed protein product [Adineta ricciae]CAF1425638.1 unnamed protein product [Adineta ricciae]